MKVTAHRRTTEFTYALPETVPVIVGHLPLGAACGILMEASGFGLDQVLAASLIVSAGSLQYLGVILPVGTVNPVYAFLMGLMINARHLLYGISILDKFRDIKGRKKLYLVFALTGEAFSVLCDEGAPGWLDKGGVYLWISALDHVYWTIGSLLRAAIGSMTTFNTAGFDFALTVLFVMIFVGQWKSQKDHRPAMIRLLASVLRLVIWGVSIFIVSAMTLILAVSTFNHKKEERAQVGRHGES